MGGAEGVLTVGMRTARALGMVVPEGALLSQFLLGGRLCWRNEVGFACSFWGKAVVVSERHNGL